jgi:hypothetical protein|tara:strand:+ start:217 stop:423 length:207 start_codon:yes stop_codon:yes gene_type:complete
MKKGLAYLRDLTERLLSCESPRPCIDLRKVVAGFKCSDRISKSKDASKASSLESGIVDITIEEDNRDV